MVQLIVRVADIWEVQGRVAEVFYRDGESLEKAAAMRPELPGIIRVEVHLVIAVLYKYNYLKPELYV